MKLLSFKSRLLLLGYTAAFSLFSKLSVAAVTPGTLLITEVMANPAAVSDSNGEWFEIYNASHTAIDLNGLNLRDNGSNNHTVSSALPLYIEAGDYFVFGRHASQQQNGGVEVDHVLTNFTLSNSSDAIVLFSEGLEIVRLEYTTGSVFGVSGQSAELTASGFALTPVTFSYGDGDIGSPGGTGSYQPASVSNVPLPAASWLFGSAVLGLLKLKRRTDS